MVIAVTEHSARNASRSRSRFEHRQFSAHDHFDRNPVPRYGCNTQDHDAPSITKAGKETVFTNLRRGCNDQVLTIREEPRDFGSEESMCRITRTVENDEYDHTLHTQQWPAGRKWENSALSKSLTGKRLLVGRGPLRDPVQGQGCSFGPRHREPATCRRCPSSWVVAIATEQGQPSPTE